MPATLKDASRPATRPAVRRPAMVINEHIQVPDWVGEFETFRMWCRSAEYPERGRVFWYGETLWVNNDLEALPTHNTLNSNSRESSPI